MPLPVQESEERRAEVTPLSTAPASCRYRRRPEYVLRLRMPTGGGSRTDAQLAGCACHRRLPGGGCRARSAVMTQDHMVASAHSWVATASCTKWPLSGPNISPERNLFQIV